MIVLLSRDPLAFHAISFWHERYAPNTPQLAMRMADRAVSFGHMDVFNPENETITAYLERFDLFIQANGVAEGKKVPVFLSVLGSKTYTLLRNLLSPALPKDKDFAKLARELTSHFEPKKVVIVEQFNFYCRNQQAG